MLKTLTRDIPIEMQYGFRKRLTLTVYPNQKVIARIPHGFPKRKIDEYFKKKTSWMIKHLDHFEQHPPEKDKRYVAGEKFTYLGNSYTLKLIIGSSRVELNGSYLTVRVKDPENKDLVADALARWYRREAIRILTSRFHELFNRLKYLDLPEIILRFYKMKRRWGSCSSKGVITLNTELIKREQALIDYVIIHEICHLKVPAHNKEFYALLGSIVPDWKERRNILNYG